MEIVCVQKKNSIHFALAISTYAKKHTDTDSQKYVSKVLQTLRGNSVSKSMLHYSSLVFEVAQ